ncbi:hypothetical protein KIPB_015183, partial [Kipferlia bialata]
IHIPLLGSVVRAYILSQDSGFLTHSGGNSRYDIVPF